MPISVKVPASINNSRRSRAVSFSWACWRAIFSSPPPSLISARRASRSSTSGRRIEVLACVLISALSTALALLKERRHALDDVLRGHGEGELCAQVVEGIVEIHVQAAGASPPCPSA